MKNKPLMNFLIPAQFTTVWLDFGMESKPKMTKKQREAEKRRNLLSGIASAIWFVLVVAGLIVTFIASSVAFAVSVGILISNLSK